MAKSFVSDGFNGWKATIDANGFWRHIYWTRWHGNGFHWEPTIAQTTHCLLPKHRSGLQLGNICIDHWLFVLFIFTKGKELWISYTLVGSTIAAIPATALVKENYNRSDADKELNKSDS